MIDETYDPYYEAQAENDSDFASSLDKEENHDIDLSAVMYFREHATRSLNGDDIFIVPVDRVIELMVGFHKSQL